MNPGFDPQGFAREWALAWNARDLDRVLAHFENEVVFSTPKALDAVGRPTVRGVAALRSYWEKALGRITSLRFTVQRAVWDPTLRELGIVYDREVNGASDRALELLRFGPGGKVVSGEVFYGVQPGAGA
ncbi:MAG TPA: nuclear transport factor 2 family protein [Gemmatimonadales bacterium]|nr:nuclear transport factor 2 family protein [Gemmatimonadales bacterium]